MVTAKLKKHDMKATSEGKRIALGILSAAAATIGLTLLQSIAISTERIQLHQSAIAYYLIWILSSAIGCLIGIGHLQEKKMIKAGIIVAGYLVFLIAISIITFYGSLQNILQGILCCVIGGMIGCFCKTRRKPVKHRWK